MVGNIVRSGAPSAIPWFIITRGNGPSATGLTTKASTGNGKGSAHISSWIFGDPATSSATAEEWRIGGHPSKIREIRRRFSIFLLHSREKERRKCHSKGKWPRREPFDVDQPPKVRSRRLGELGIRTEFRNTRAVLSMRP